MEDNSIIDLKKLKRHLPPPPIEVAPLAPAATADLSRSRVVPHVAAPPPAPLVQAQSVASAPTPPIKAPPRVPLMLPPKPKMQIKLWKFQFALPPIKYLVIALFTAIAVAFGGYYIYVHFWTKSPFGPTTIDSSAEVAAASTAPAELTEAEIIDRVGKILLLPTDEAPALAKVSDPKALDNQTFFKNANIGDVVLMYPNNKKAILYDPLQNKIIEVAPFSNTTSTSTPAVSK